MIFIDKAKQIFSYYLIFLQNIEHLSTYFPNLFDFLLIFVNKILPY